MDGRRRWNNNVFISCCSYKNVSIVGVRVLEYDTETKEVTVIMENLRFPNGIQLLPDEESVLVAETTMARIRRSVSSCDGCELMMANTDR